MNSALNITDLFFEAAKKNPDKKAIVYNNSHITFSELEIQINQTIYYFISKGIKKGDRVLIFVPMSIDLYRIVLALFKMGAVAVFLDEWVSKKRMEECCKVAQCKAFVGIFKARILSFFSSELRKIPIKLGVSYSNSNNSNIKIEDTFYTDTALITFTTGSTGIPKAAKRTHGFLLAQFNALLDKLNPTPDEVAMPVLPIVTLINLGTGNTSVIATFKPSKPHTLKPELVIEQIKKNGVNQIIASPFFIKILAKYLVQNNIQLQKVKKIFTGGAPVFPNEAELYYKAFPEADVQIVFGSTEAEPISSIAVNNLIKSANEVLSKGLNVGIPYHGTKVKIIEVKDDNINVSSYSELEKLELQRNAIGEIIVAGKHVLREYYNNDEALKRNKIFIGDDCWHRTGDSGFLDETGKLYLTGRCNMLINHQNELLAPFLFEAFFQSIAGVEMGTVLMFEDKLVAIIELNNLKIKEQVKLQVEQLKTKFDSIEFVDKIPRDPRHNSKIDYALLKKKII